jgi:hypothetical protein
MIPINWTTSREKPPIDQVGSFIDRKIECALSKIREEVSSPIPKEYTQGLEKKVDARLRAHHQFLEGAKDSFGFTKIEYDACQSWYRLSKQICEAQGAFEQFIENKNREMSKIFNRLKTNAKDSPHFQLNVLLQAHKRLLIEYYFFAKASLSNASFVLDKDTIRFFFEFYQKVVVSQSAILDELTCLDATTLSSDMQSAVQYATKKHDDLLDIFQDYLKSHSEADLQKFEDLLYHSTIDTNFNRKLVRLLGSESTEAQRIIFDNEEPFSILKEFSYKSGSIERATVCVKTSVALAERIVKNGVVEDHEKLSPQDTKVLCSLMNFKGNLILLKKAGVRIPQVFFFLELIEQFEKVLKKVPSPDLSKGTLFVYDGPTFDEYFFQQQSILTSLTARLTKGPEAHAGIIITNARNDVFFSHVLRQYVLEEISQPFLPPYLIAYKVDLKNLVQEEALPLIKDLLGDEWEDLLEGLWTKSKSLVADSTELPDTKNGYLHQITSVFKPTSKLSGFDPSSIESVKDRGKTNMFCSEYARLSLIATSNVFEKKLKKKLLKKAEKPGFEEHKKALETIPCLIYHLAHEKSRIGSSTPAALVDKYQRESKKSPKSAKYRKAILVPLDQVDTETWANWGKLFRLPKSSSIE